MTWFVTLAAVLSGVTAVTVCVAATAGRRMSIVTAALGVATLAAASVVVLVLGVARGLDLFGIAHVLYLQTVLAVPLLGVGLLALAAWRSTTAAGALAAAVLILPAPIGFWGSHVAPFRLRVDEHRVVADSTGTQSTVRIAVLSDLQTTGVGDHERAAVQAVMDARPDLIVLPGDLFQADGEVLAERGPGVRELLSQLSAPAGVYVVQGDVDSPQRWATVLPPNVEVLDDEVVELRIRDRRVRLGGTRLDVTTPAADAVRRDLAADDEALTVLVSHRPDAVLQLPPSAGIDLVIAGHTHGGQLAVPFLGPPLTLSKVPRQVGAGGLHQVDGNLIYVSTGVGMERGQAPQVRLFVPPSVGVLDLG